MAYQDELYELDVRVREAIRVKETLLSSLKNLSLSQAQLLVRWNQQCGIIEEECADISMSGLPIVWPAKDSIYTMQNYLQLKQIEISELVQAIKSLFDLVENINMRKERIVQKSLEKTNVPDLIKEADEVLFKDVIAWLENEKKLGNIVRAADVNASKDMCHDFVVARFNIPNEKFEEIWEKVTGVWHAEESSK